MECLLIKKYEDFELIIEKLKNDNQILIDLSSLNNKMKVRIIDLVVGYIHDIGMIKKESVNRYLVSIKV